MRRLIIHFIVAVVTFSIGTTAESLLTVNRHTFALGVPAIRPSAVNAAESPVHFAVTASPPDLICDYDPGEFNPRGDYYEYLGC